MDHNKQVADVKKALDLEQKISVTKDKIAQLQQQSFKPKPTPPVRQQAVKTVPEIKPTIKFSWIIAIVLAFIPFISIVGSIIYYLIYRYIKKQQIEKIQVSPEYKKQCEKAEQDFQRQQQQFDNEYQAALDEYNSVTLPEYEQAFTMWKSAQSAKISECESVLSQAEVELTQHYEDTKIVPLKYRTIPALQYIYDMVSTSDFSVRDSIDSFEKAEQQRLDRARLEEQQRANRLAEEQNQLADEQNYLLDQQNEIANKARRDANIAAAVSAVQRHNTNKALNRRR